MGRHQKGEHELPKPTSNGCKIVPSSNLLVEITQIKGNILSSNYYILDFTQNWGGWRIGGGTLELDQFLMGRE